MLKNIIGLQKDRKRERENKKKTDQRKARD